MAPTRLNTHTAAEKAFIVRKLAAFEPPRAIVAAFAAVFPQSTCNENDVLATDPETTVVAPELLMLFKTERERVLLDPGSAVFADQAARLIALSNQAKFYAGNNQFGEMREVLRQIAAEQGIGVKGGPAKTAAPAGTGQEPIEEIRVTIVDPKPAPVAE